MREAEKHDIIFYIFSDLSAASKKKKENGDWQTATEILSRRS